MFVKTFKNISAELIIVIVIIATFLLITFNPFISKVTLLRSQIRGESCRYIYILDAEKRNKTCRYSITNSVFHLFDDKNKCIIDAAGCISEMKINYNEVLSDILSQIQNIPNFTREGEEIPDVRTQLILSLGVFINDNNVKLILPVLSSVLQGTTANSTKIAVANILEEIGPLAENMQTFLLLLIENKDPQVRKAALNAFLKINNTNTFFESKLIKVFKNFEIEYLTIAEILNKLKDYPQLVSRIEEYILLVAEDLTDTKKWEIKLSEAKSIDEISKVFSMRAGLSLSLWSLNENMNNKFEKVIEKLPLKGNDEELRWMENNHSALKRVFLEKFKKSDSHAK